MATFRQVLTQYQDLEATFLEAVDAFNNRRWEELKGLLDDNVAVGTVRPQPDTETVRGKDAVIQYLQVVAKDDSMFTPIAPISANVRRGIVSGQAIWKDRDNPTQPPTYGEISYSFIFTLVAGQRWLILNLYATPD